MLLAAPAHAAVQEMRIVGVGIDNSSLKAEEIALDYAKKRAVYLAARKLGISNASEKVAKFSTAQMDQIIRGVNVTQTRRVEYTTYLEVQVTIVDTALQRALKLPDDYRKKIDTDMPLRGVLVLAGYAGKDRAYLWEKDNVFREAISDEIRRQSRGGVLLPGGDMDDLKLIDYENMLKVEPAELEPMFNRYGADEIIIAVLTMGQPGTSDNTSVLLRRLQPKTVRHEIIEIPVASNDEPIKTRLAKAASALATAVTQIASSTAERDKALRAGAKTIPLRFNYSVPKDLAKMQNAIRTAPDVIYLDMASIALARVSGTVYLKGDETSFREHLVKQGVLVSTTDDGWRLSVR